MKQNAKRYMSVVWLLLAALAVVTGIAGLEGFQALYPALAVSVVAGVFALVRMAAIGRDEEGYWRQVGGQVDDLQSRALIELPLSVLVTDGQGRILWYNQQCQEQVFSAEEGYGTLISQLIPPAGLQALKEGKSCETAFEEREYSVYCSQPDPRSGLVVYYFAENTTLKQLTREYYLSRPSVLTISVDSYEELQQSAKDNDRTQLLSQVEYQLEKFAGEHEGLLCKIDRDRFVAVFEERHMKEIMEERFHILDKVRALSSDDRFPITLSIGVGRGGASFSENEQMSHQALDMALGRGGDQVALKTETGYDFYGGVSKGIEKRTKVKTRIVATALRELVESSEQVILMGHKFADLDCFGAAVGLYRVVREMGKPAVIAIDPQKNLVQPLIERLGASGYQGAFARPDQLLPKVTSKTLLIIVDTHIQHVAESAELYKACQNVVVIDHHRRMVGYIDNAVIFYHEPYASSASEMVTELVQYFGEKYRLGRPEAEALLAGIMLDTKNFVIKTGVRTFEAAAYLRRLGADTVEVRKLFSSSMESYQRRSRMVSSAEVYRNCAIAHSNGVTDDIKIVAPQAADELLNISNVDASFVLYEYDGGVSFSARSMGQVNVQLIMEKLGGGGHQTMAGAQLSNISLEAARQRLLEAIDEYYEEKAEESRR